MYKATCVPSSVKKIASIIFFIEVSKKYLCCSCYK